MKTYLVIERFKVASFDKIYERLSLKGRMLPDGLFYLDSWVSKSENICFQLMQTDDKTLFGPWIRKWMDYIDFEIVEVND